MNPENPDSKMKNNHMHKLDVREERDRQLAGERPIPYVIRLYLELETEDTCLGKKEIGVLAQYEKMVNRST